jgi:hypothetical protein
MAQTKIKKANSSRKEKVIEGLPVMGRNRAGSDSGSKSHWVCAPTVEGSEREIAEFGAESCSEWQYG